LFPHLPEVAKRADLVLGLGHAIEQERQQRRDGREHEDRRYRELDFLGYRQGFRQGLHSAAPLRSGSLKSLQAFRRE
jgi:hypothetical protein